VRRWGRWRATGLAGWELKGRRQGSEVEVSRCSSSSEQSKDVTMKVSVTGEEQQISIADKEVPDPRGQKIGWSSLNRTKIRNHS
jgi:hypothetical protein